MRQIFNSNCMLPHECGLNSPLEYVAVHVYSTSRGRLGTDGKVRGVSFYLVKAQEK